MKVLSFVQIIILYIIHLFIGPIFRVFIYTVKSVEIGPNILIWTMNGGICGDQSKDTVIVNFELLPTATQDQHDLFQAWVLSFHRNI